MRWVRSIAWIALVAAAADALPEQDRHVPLVPWKVVEKGETVDAPLVLFWIPSSREELRRSPLLTSNDLTLYASRCVAMRVVRADDDARLASLHVETENPAVILADGEGHVVAAVEAERGRLSVHAVEEIVRAELEDRVARAESSLDTARRLTEEGEELAARAVYESVWEQRCVCPRQAKAAQRALRRLEKK
jgi:hypothetical protein